MLHLRSQLWSVGSDCLEHSVHSFVHSTNTPANIDKGLLKGTLTREQITKDADKEYYILSDEYVPVGFYIAGNGAKNEYFWNDANKAYLVISKEAAQGSTVYHFETDNATGVSQVKGESGEVKAIYDLQGRKVDAPSKGLYIIDGKKAYIK